MRLGAGEMLVVLVIALLVFGPNKLPQLGDALGRGIRNFKKAASTDEPAPGSQDGATPALPAAGSRVRAGPAAGSGRAATHGSIDPE